MNNDTFNEVLERRIGLIRQVLQKKTGEYAQEGDRLFNFKQAGAMDGSTSVEALWGMMKKHLVSVMDLVFKRLPNQEAYVDEKIGDAINYLILMEALLREERKAEDADFKKTLERVMDRGAAPEISARDIRFAEADRVLHWLVSKARERGWKEDQYVLRLRKDLFDEIALPQYWKNGGVRYHGVRLEVAELNDTCALVDGGSIALLESVPAEPTKSLREKSEDAWQFFSDTFFDALDKNPNSKVLRVSLALYDVCKRHKENFLRERAYAFEHSEDTKDLYNEYAGKLVMLQHTGEMRIKGRKVVFDPALTGDREFKVE